MPNRFIITLLTGLLLIGGTILAIQFAKGYRVNLKQKKVVGNGLLVANSFPTGASVYINDKLTTATDNTLNLSPGDYKIKITKEGFTTWEKSLTLKKELVTQTNAQLFPAVPNLKALTFNGVANIVSSPDGEKIAYAVASASASPKNGLYIMDLAGRSIIASRDPRQIAKNTSAINFAKVKLLWSPDSKQILAQVNNSYYLLETDRLNDAASLTNISNQLSLYLNDWEDQLRLKNEARLKKLPAAFREIIQDKAKNWYFSPDEEKLMYTATAAATLAKDLISPPPQVSDQPETRILEPDKIYIYDLKEDKNFYISQVNKSDKNTSQIQSKLAVRLDNIDKQYSPLGRQSVQWFPSSKHLIEVEKDKIVVREYDGQNRMTVYAGPFQDSFVYPWPDGSKLIILTNLNPDSSLPSNLYAIDLK